MRFAVESWSTDYGSATSDLELATPKYPVETDVEVATGDWAPRSVATDVEPCKNILLTDGVRRVDARVWIQDREGRTRPGLCASYAAGVVRCDGRAEVIAAQVQRGLFTPASGAESIETRHGTFEMRAVAGDSPEQLSLALQQRMTELEVTLAAECPAAELIVIDGPLLGRQQVANAIGYVKTHHVAYLPDVVSDVVAQLQPRQRTPLFLTTTSWSRYSWYLKLPSPPAHPWSGVVRCEASANLAVEQVVRLADIATASLPKFASEPHRDPRAPQNLYPIAGLEQVLRHRLGDPQLIYRALCAAAASVTASA